MTQYIIRRLIYALFIIWGCATIVFFLLRLVPGDPVSVMLGREYTPQAAAQMRKNLGLDQPIYVQYVKWMGNVLHGNLGKSIDTKESVSGQIAEAFPKTLSITILAFIFGVVVAVPMGMLAALRRNSIFDYLASGITLIGISLPTFWFGIVFILIFAVQFRWLPSVGYVSPRDGVWPWFEHLILPAFAAGVGEAAILVRFVRAGLLEVLGSDYVRTARAKGLRETRVILNHAMRNSMIPVVTIAGLSLAGLLGGLVITETVFAISGIGRLLTTAIFAKDYPIVQGVILLITLFFVLANLAVDILYTFLDPRIRYG
ncbi:MAG TPA: ABC transporter permease [Nitrolancea sp.]|jgi:peptide/nickel transport system permease protein|nr:ABC transporter permease [Nitrolancea sp.]